METYYQRYIESGGLIMVFLIPCSLLALGYAVQGFVNLRRSRLLPPGMRSAMRAPIAAREIRNTIAQAGNSNTLFDRIVARLTSNGASIHLSSEDVSEIISDEIGRLYQQNSHLTVIYTIAPLLGLLGTVLGMMKSFYLFGASDNPSVAQLSRGINEALVTTMWGLFIAIPSFVVVNIFRYRLLRYQRDTLPRLVRHVMSVLHEQVEDSASGGEEEAGEVERPIAAPEDLHSRDEVDRGME